MTDNSNDFILPSRKAQLVLVIFLLLMCSGMFLVESQIEAIMIDDSLSRVEVKALFTHLINRLLGMMVAFSTLLSGYSLYLAHRIHQFKQFPPPDCAVIRKTKIKRGSAANKAKWIAYFMALIAYTPVVFIIALKYVLVDLI